MNPGELIRSTQSFMPFVEFTSDGCALLNDRCDSVPEGTIGIVVQTRFRNGNLFVYAIFQNVIGWALHSWVKEA
jgi:hypothetical protein